MCIGHVCKHVCRHVTCIDMCIDMCVAIVLQYRLENCCSWCAVSIVSSAASGNGCCGRARVFFQYLGACRRRTQRTCIDLKVPKDASDRDLSDATLRFDLAPRCSPSACAEIFRKTDPCSGSSKKSSRPTGLRRNRRGARRTRVEMRHLWTGTDLGRGYRYAYRTCV